MAEATPVTVLVHTRNSAATLPRLLASVRWAAEIVVVDMASEDDTRALAAAAGARVLAAPVHPRVDAIRTRFLGEARHPWILVLDDDEHLADDAAAEIARLLDAYGARFDAFAIPRFNWFGDRRLEGSGWYPDHQIRLVRRGRVEWEDAIHRHPRVLGGPQRVLRLDPPNCLHIHHANYTDLGHVVSKQAEYARHDRYDPDPAAFSFEAYVADAFVEYRRRLDRDRDGDYSVALATIMAWDRIVRGLIHWDRLGRPTPLPDVFALPIVLRPRRTLRAQWRDALAGLLRALRGRLTPHLARPNARRRGQR